MLTLVDPAATGWKVEVALLALAANDIGLVTVATPVLELTMPTLTGAAPGRTPCEAPDGTSAPFSTEVPTVTVPSPVEPLLLFPLVITKPEGASVIVVVPSVRSVPVAVRVTVPLLARA